MQVVCDVMYMQAAFKLAEINSHLDQFACLENERSKEGQRNLECKRIMQAHPSERPQGMVRCTIVLGMSILRGVGAITLPLVSRSREVRGAVSLLTGKNNAVEGVSQGCSTGYQTYQS